MSSYLCIAIRFLDADRAFHGRGEAGEPEWPPSPLRLFQALVAAAASRWPGAQFQEAARPAMQWLERQQASAIVAPAHRVGTPVRIAVPNNDLDIVATGWAEGRTPKRQPNELKTMKTVRPTRLLVKNDEPAIVHYLFSVTNGACPYLDTLTAAARAITHLGWGVDMVAGNVELLTAEEAATLPGERWQPVGDPSAPGYRVPVAGTFEALLRKHRAFLARIGPEGFIPVLPLSAYRTVGYRRTTDVPHRPYIGFKLLHPELERSAWFSPTRANRVAAMLRHATANAARHQPREWVESYVHGHRSNGDDDQQPRFSYVPLPTIEHRGEGSFVVGGIRRVMVVELSPGSESRLLWARQMLPGQFLEDEEGSERKAMLAPLNESDWVLQQYTARSDTWATVTPVILPGSDDGRLAKAEKLFRKALGHAGYSVDALADAPEFRNVSFWPGGDLALRFQRPDYLRNGHWSVYHMRLRWKEPIKGPLAIGAGRHCGLGIFAQMSNA